MTTTSYNYEQAAGAIIQRLAGANSGIQTVERWGGGALNVCYKVSTSRPAGKFFLKFENDDAFPTTRRGQIAREVNGIRLAGEAGICVPEVLAYDLTGTETGRKYLVERFIDGELMWEIRDALTVQERETLRTDASALVERMNGITSPLFGDLYPGGPIGQHPTWALAYRSWASALLEDSRALGLFSAADDVLVASALARGAAVLHDDTPAGLYHGDLGLHNVMVDRSRGIARMGTVIDFGNALFAPGYANEAGTRAHGGFGLDPLDAQVVYGISKAAQEADELLFWFEQVLFFAALKRRHNWDPGFPFLEQFLESVSQPGEPR